MFQTGRKWIVSPLIFSFVWASVVCCCLSYPSHAEDPRQDFHHNTQGITHKSHCESHDSKGKHSDKKHECECPKMQGELAASPEVLKSAGAVLALLNPDALAAQSFLNSPDMNLLRYDHSPPQLVTRSLPLYLKHSVLRI